MLQILRKFLFRSLTLTLLGPLVACTGSRQNHPDGALQVKVPLFGTDGNYALQVVELLSLGDLVELKGWAAKFLLAPTQVGRELQGYQPKIRTIKSAGGVHIATDELSLQLLTVYYHMENLGLLDEMVGVKDLNSWPRTVAVNVNYVAKDGNGQRAENNALYSGELDALLFVPYTEGSLAIMANGGIIGHEHFHSLFHKIFAKPLGAKYPRTQTTLHQEEGIKAAFGFSPPSPGIKDGEFEISRSARLTGMVSRDDYHSYLLRGLNEGLADFWGWLYSGDIDFVGHSLPQLSAQRKLTGAEKVPDEACFTRSLTYSSENGDDYPGPVSKAYKYGSSLARNLQAFAVNYQKKRELSNLQMRKEIGTALLKALNDLRENFSGLGEEETLGTTQILVLLSKNLTTLSQEEMAFLNPAPNPDLKDRKADSCR
jgi:hypothetical protein